MNYARIYSWNPFRLNQFAYQGETSSAPGGVGASSPASTPSTSGSPPAPSGTPSDGSSSPGSSETPGAGEGTSTSDPFAEFGDDDFLDLGDSSTDDGSGEAPPTPAGVTPPPAAKVPPAETPPAAVTPPAETPPATVPSGPRTAREEMQGAVSDFKNNFKELSDWASTELFPLSQEDRDSLDTDAGAAIPKLMGRVYTQAIMAATNIALNFVPRMISEGVVQQQASSAKANEAKTQFYAAWPQLNEAAHGEAFNQWAKMFRQMNPKASRADAIKFVGQALMTQFGLQGGPQAPASGAPSRPVPFQPARPGGRPPTSTQVVDDPYAGMDQDFMDSGE